MLYKYYLSDDEIIVLVEAPELFDSISGAIFRKIIKDKFGEELNVVAAYKVEDGKYMISSESLDTIFTEEFIDAIPSTEWNEFNWG